MNWFEALILGIVQGLTEFLPVSSSGHLEIGKVLLNTEVKENLTFAIVVHGATVLSTIVVFRKDILDLLKDFFQFRWNESTKYIVKIIVSMIPVIFVGLFLKEEIEKYFTGNMVFVGSMLLITSILLIFTYFSRNNTKEISFIHAFIIGIAQAIAVLPGISRSGSTIATGILLGNKKEELAKFSFLMVLVPIIAANILDLMSNHQSIPSERISPVALIVGFITAFITGFLACKWMVSIVRKGKLVYFGIYCFIIGIIAILFLK